MPVFCFSSNSIRVSKQVLFVTVHTCSCAQLNLIAVVVFTTHALVHAIIWQQYLLKKMIKNQQHRLTIKFHIAKSDTSYDCYTFYLFGKVYSSLEIVFFIQTLTLSSNFIIKHWRAIQRTFTNIHETLNCKQTKTPRGSL